MSWWRGPGVGFVYAVVEEGGGEGWEGESLCGEVWDGGKWACRFRIPFLISALFCYSVFGYFINPFEYLFLGESADSAAAVC